MESNEIAREMLIKAFPKEISKWEALIDILEDAVDTLWPEGEEQNPHLILAGRFGSLPVSLYTSTTTPCNDVNVVEEVADYIKREHDTHHGTNPKTGLSPMDTVLTYEEALAEGSVPDSVRAKIEKAIAEGYPSDRIRVVRHINTLDLTSMPEVDEPTYSPSEKKEGE